MSSRAAWRLETLGFTQVYRYEPGKSDWFANGLPIEGKRSGVPRAGDVARRDVPTCHLGERVGDVRDRVRAADRDTCLVVTDGNVVLGRLRKDELASDATAVVDDVMEPGPTTIRPDELLETLVPRLKERRGGKKIGPGPRGETGGKLVCDDAQRRPGGVKAGEGYRDQPS